VGCTDQAAIVTQPMVSYSSGVKRPSAGRWRVRSLLVIIGYRTPAARSTFRHRNGGNYRMPRVVRLRRSW